MRLERDMEAKVRRADTPPKMSVTGFAEFLKGKSGLTVYKRWSDIKF